MCFLSLSLTCRAKVLSPMESKLKDACRGTASATPSTKPGRQIRYLLTRALHSSTAFSVSRSCCHCQAPCDLTAGGVSLILCVLLLSTQTACGRSRWDLSRTSSKVARISAASLGLVCSKGCSSWILGLGVAPTNGLLYSSARQSMCGTAVAEYRQLSCC